MRQNSPKGMVVVTGCDSGIGHGMIEPLLDQGWSVLAGCRNEPPFTPHANLICWHLDLRDSASIAEFAEVAARKSKHGVRVAYVVSNAGMVTAAPVEDMPLDGLRDIFQVNYFGAYELIQRLIPTIIHDRSRIIINSSLAGRVAAPFVSPYVSSKFALEGFAETLRLELLPFGVTTTVLDTGAVATPIWTQTWERLQAEMLPRIGERWKAACLDFARIFVAGGNAGWPTAYACRRILVIMAKKRPRAHYFLSRNRALDWLKVILPTWLRDRLTIKLFGMDRLAKADSHG